MRTHYDQLEAQLQALFLDSKLESGDSICQYTLPRLQIEIEMDWKASADLAVIGSGFDAIDPNAIPPYVRLASPHGQKRLRAPGESNNVALYLKHIQLLKNAIDSICEEMHDEAKARHALKKQNKCTQGCGGAVEAGALVCAKCKKSQLIIQRSSLLQFSSFSIVAGRENAFELRVAFQKRFSSTPATVMLHSTLETGSLPDAPGVMRRLALALPTVVGLQTALDTSWELEQMSSILQVSDQRASCRSKGGATASLQKQLEQKDAEIERLKSEIDRLKLLSIESEAQAPGVVTITPHGCPSNSPIDGGSPNRRGSSPKSKHLQGVRGFTFPTRGGPQRRPTVAASSCRAPQSAPCAGTESKMTSCEPSKAHEEVKLVNQRYGDHIREKKCGFEGKFGDIDDFHKGEASMISPPLSCPPPRPSLSPSIFLSLLVRGCRQLQLHPRAPLRVSCCEMAVRVKGGADIERGLSQA